MNVNGDCPNSFIVLGTALVCGSLLTKRPGCLTSERHNTCLELTGYLFGGERGTVPIRNRVPQISSLGFMFNICTLQRLAKRTVDKMCDHADPAVARYSARRGPALLNFNLQPDVYIDMLSRDRIGVVQKTLKLEPSYKIPPCAHDLECTRVEVHLRMMRDLEVPKNRLDSYAILRQSMSTRGLLSQF